MDTASKQPFELMFIVHYGEYSKKQYTEFTLDEAKIDSINIVEIEENDEVSIYFNSGDREARLYLEALDIIPNNYGIIIDDQGEVYRGISDTEMPLYRNTTEFDALRVDQFSIVVVCNGKKYYGMLSIKPKQLNTEEWRSMKDDLEEELNGLAMDIVRKNIGIGNKNNLNMPPEHLYKFLVMKKYQKKVIQALMDIQEKPKFRVLKQYELKSQGDSANLDGYSIKQYLKRVNNENYFVPKKVISYDISENRVLKYILSYYKRELRKILTIVNNSLQGVRELEENKQYISIYSKTLQQYKDAAEKLERITSIIENKTWFKEINENKDINISHSLAMDSRYGTIYRMYRELKDSNIRIAIDPMYSYSWKKSSTLYEMWCYIKLCRMLQNSYEMMGDLLIEGIQSEFIVPFLKKGAKTSFLSNEIRLDVLYNPTLERSKEKAEKVKMPYYMLGNHVKPDIVINIFYMQRNNMYIGSIVLECKYRKLSSFWYQGSTMSSRRQIEAYYEDSKSNCYYNMGDEHDVRPVRKVFVLTPDDVNINEVERNISLRQFKPDDIAKQQKLLVEIEDIIDGRLKLASKDSM